MLKEAKSLKGDTSLKEYKQFKGEKQRWDMS